MNENYSNDIYSQQEEEHLFKDFCNDVRKFKNKHPKIFITIVLILVFFIGFMFGRMGMTSRKLYYRALSKNETLTTNYESLETEYSEYKTKMQPYEAQQAADEKAAAEKKAAEEKAAEEKAKKEAEEKAAREAEEKRKAEEEAKKSTFGITVTEFVQQFNINSDMLGSSVTAINPSYSDSFIDINTSSDSVKLSAYCKNGYVEQVYVDCKGTGTANSGLDQIYSMVAAAKTLDSTLDTSTISNFLLEMINNTPDTGENYTQTKNGIKYTLAAMPGSRLLQLSKN